MPIFRYWAVYAQKKFRANIKPHNAIRFESFRSHHGTKNRKRKQTEIWCFRVIAQIAPHTGGGVGKLVNQRSKSASPIQKSAHVFSSALCYGASTANHESMATKSISPFRRHTVSLSASHLCNNIGKRECVRLSLARSFYLCGRDAGAGADSPHHHRRRKASERSFSSLFWAGSSQNRHSARQSREEATTTALFHAHQNYYAFQSMPTNKSLSRAA